MMRSGARRGEVKMAMLRTLAMALALVGDAAQQLGVVVVVVRCQRWS